MNKTILIAGGAGIIGSNLCKKLYDNNVKIICIDNLFTGKLDNIKELDFEELISDNQQKLEEQQSLLASENEYREQLRPLYNQVFDELLQLLISMSNLDY